MENAAKNREVRFRQFSLSMLITVMTGIGCFLGGRNYGYREGLATWDRVPMITQHHDLRFLIPPKLDVLKNPFDPRPTMDSFILKMKKDVMPEVWSENGGRMKASLSNAPYSQLCVRVDGSHLVQFAVEEYIGQAKRQMAEQLSKVQASSKLPHVK